MKSINAGEFCCFRICSALWNFVVFPTICLLRSRILSLLIYLLLIKFQNHFMLCKFKVYRLMTSSYLACDVS